MSWFKALLPLILLSACGGTVGSDGDGNGGSGGGGAPSTGGKPGTGGKSGSGGHVAREPANHRPTAEICDGNPPQSTGGVPGTYVPTFGNCKQHSDCTEGKNGRCVNNRGGGECTYDTCFADSDCESGSMCLCGTASWTGNACSTPGCRVDADCPGSWCSPTYGTCGNYSGVIGYACHTSADECVDDSDCANIPSMYGAEPYCWFSPTVAHWVCSNSQCVG